MRRSPGRNNTLLCRGMGSGGGAGCSTRILGDVGVVVDAAVGCRLVATVLRPRLSFCFSSFCSVESAGLSTRKSETLTSGSGSFGSVVEINLRAAGFLDATAALSARIHSSYCSCPLIGIP